MKADGSNSKEEKKGNSATRKKEKFKHRQSHTVTPEELIRLQSKQHGSPTSNNSKLKAVEELDDILLK